MCIIHGRVGEARRRESESQRKNVPTKRVKTVQPSSGSFKVISWEDFLPQKSSNEENVITAKIIVAHDPTRRKNREEEHNLKAIVTREGLSGQVCSNTPLLQDLYG